MKNAQLFFVVLLAGILMGAGLQDRKCNSGKVLKKAPVKTQKRPVTTQPLFEVLFRV